MKPLRILAVDISLIFTMKWEGEGGKISGNAQRNAIAAVERARDDYDRTFLACDAGASYRRQIPEYKANRTDRGEVYRAQLAETIKQLVARGCVAVEAPAVGTFQATGMPSYAEADDVIGWGADCFRELVMALPVEERKGWKFAALTDDSDIEQIIDDDANIVVVKTATRGGEEWTEKTVLEKRGVPSDRVADLKALSGDKSDDYLGFCADFIPDANPPRRGPGIGPKGAASLIKKYGSAVEIFEPANVAKWEADGVPAGTRALLERHGKAQVDVGMFLAKLGTLGHTELDFNLVLAEPVAVPIPEPDAERAEKEWPSSEPVEPAETSEPAPLAVTSTEPAEERKPSALAILRPHSAVLDPSGADWALDFQPRTAKEALHMASVFHKGGAFQKKFATPEAIWTVIMIGREHGLSVMASLQSMNMIDGKVEMAAELIVAKILRSNLAKYFSLVQSDDNGATWETHRIGEAAPLRMSFTIQEAERREIFRVDNNGRRVTYNGKTSQYQKMPDVMCMWRAATKLGRAKYADVCRGLYGEGELRERSVEDVESEAA